jgi:hypothetical protein
MNTYNKMPSNGELALILRLSEGAVKAMTWKAKNLRWRKAIGMCLKCSSPAREGLQNCAVCAAKCYGYNKKTQLRNLAEGLCRRCSEPCKPGRQMCEHHLAMASAAVIKSQMKRKQNEQAP